MAGDAQKHLGAKVYKTLVPRNVRLSEAPSYGKPAIVFYDKLGGGDEKYVAEAISHEVRGRSVV